jgi:hypothetical protein
MLMFDDVPKELSRKIRNFPEKWTLSEKYAAAAYEVAVHYTGIHFQKTMFEHFSMQNYGGVDSEERIFEFGVALFALRNEPIFPELARRIRRRQLQPTYFETECALFWRKMGYNIIPIPRVSKRGVSYDFEILDPYVYYGPKIAINVEVTELSGRTFSRESFINSLNSVGKQHPTNAPTVMMCRYPVEWRQQSGGMFAEFDRVVENFLRGSRRINSVIFFSGVTTLIQGTTLSKGTFHRMAYVNKNPFYFDKILNGTLLRLIQTEELSGPLDIFKWVDWIFSAEFG